MNNVCIEGKPDTCGCCELKERFENLYDRTHACILSINGQTPDGDGAISIDIPDVQELEEDIQDVHNYAAAIGEDLTQNYFTKTECLQGFATQQQFAELEALFTRSY